MPDGDFRSKFKKLSPQQQKAADRFREWLLSSTAQVFYLAGPAGTGKSELLVQFGSELPGVQFCVYTARLASVLRQRGASNATTLHSLLYGPPLVRDNGELVWKRRHDRPEAQFLFVDEVGLVGQQLGHDLRKTGIRLYATGDPFQLTPIDGRPFFAGKPDFTLTEIHRQAAGSQPLVLATQIRKGLSVRPVPFDLNVVREADIALSALNGTRMWLTNAIRKGRGICDANPIIGDRVICLKTDHARHLYNGSLWTVEQRIQQGRSPVHALFLVDDIGARIDVLAHEDGWYCTRLDKQSPEYRDIDLFAYGDVLTVHKAMGSEWDNVVIVDETDTPGFEWIAGQSGLPLAEYKRRWLYTAVTRAKTHVTIMEPPR